MRIGIDFDNTIVCYDGVFHQVALAQQIIPQTLDTDKDSVRDYLRRQGRESLWTELQGAVYGRHIRLCPSYPGFLDFLRAALRQGHDICVVSHKTHFPIIGDRLDLHAAAQGWLSAAGVFDLIARESVYFELTKEEKLARIGQVGCDVFIDDLPEFLREPGFPNTVRPILFDPTGRHGASSDYLRIVHWDEAAALLLGNR